MFNVNSKREKEAAYLSTAGIAKSNEDGPAIEEVEETQVENAFHGRYKVGTH